MQLSEYQKLTSRTNTDLGSKAINAAHVTLGIVGEYEEFEDVIGDASIEKWRHGKITEELSTKVKLEGGDICWYISELANTFNIELSPLDYDISTEECIGWIAETIKKYLAYNREVNVPELQKRLERILWHIHESLESYDITLEDCLDANITKLQKRFPEKFTAELALAKGDEQ